MPAWLHTLSLKSTRVHDRFWSEWQRQMAQVGIPHQWKKCEETGRIENLRRCARGEKGGFQGLRFNDSDVYKLLEATAYASTLGMGAHLTEVTGEATDLIAAAQMPDGYVNTYVQLDHPNMRWRSLNALHEMYCIGHLVEAAVAHSEATGRARLLEVAKNAADHVMDQFPSSGPPACGDHQELELALVRLADATGQRKYADYAAWQIRSRGARPSRFEAELQDPAVVALTPGVKALYVKNGHYDGAYAQDDLPLVAQTRAVGHAVRAMYFYSGAVDALSDDEPTMAALQTIWDGLVSRQMYVTGGIGSSGRNEGFTTDYDLPNLDAYAETCAGIGLVYWAWRMFLASGDGRYLDVLERALYNAVLSGVSPSCDLYFYDNPLESDGRHAREPWFTCACCPPNIARLVMSIGQYAVASGDGSVRVAMPIGGVYQTPCAQIEIEGDYPWSGDYSVRVASASGLRSLGVRVPEWAGVAEVRVNGEAVEDPCERGFIVVEREWRSGDVVEVLCPIGAQWVSSHPSVLANAGRVALQRGPLIYCMEQHDNGFAPQHWSADLSRRPTEDGRTVAAEGTLDSVRGEDLYATAQRTSSDQRQGLFVPYHTWADRGPIAMQVWVRRSTHLR